LAGVSSSTVYRWIARQSQPDFDSIRLLVRHLPNRRGQEAILQVFMAGTEWSANHQQVELDVNDDGRVDAEDALDASIEAVRAAGRSLAQVRATNQSQALDPEETLELIGQLNHVIRQCTITQRVLIEMSEQRRRRKLKLGSDTASARPNPTAAKLRWGIALLAPRPFLRVREQGRDQSAVSLPRRDTPLPPAARLRVPPRGFRLRGRSFIIARRRPRRRRRASHRQLHRIFYRTLAAQRPAADPEPALPRPAHRRAS